ncbi:PKD domain-containing protein [Terrimonas sp.]|uniref:PKD domain-containing protein n=1 Tax=Terrimonas sp. TaxID=1914338 RepID=UPI0014029472|nr:PKD domain-containing protein [Terrimonas sp.]
MVNPGDDIPADKEITANISGKVWDEEGLPVNEAVITVGSITTQTNELGSFSLSNVKIMERNGFIRIEKEGYFKGLKTVNIDAGRENNIEVKLQKRTLTATFNAPAGATVAVDDGSQIIFDADAIIKDADKSAYSGVVKVYAKYINPTAKDFLQIMPGNLVGFTAKNEEVRLISFGMLNVELEGESGEKLQLAEGKPATISAEIPEQLLSQATSSIPLWYMDENSGPWKEEGFATKEGNRFTGKVSHFSFWNYDYYAGLPLYKIKARFVDKNNAPVAYKKFTISTNGVRHQEDFTDSTGSINFMGSRDSMIIKIWVNPCNSNIPVFKVGPFSNDTDLGNLMVDDTSSTNILKGKLAVCDSRVLQNDGLLYLYEGTRFLQSTRIDSSGKFIVIEGEVCLTNIPSINFRFYNSRFAVLKDTTMIFPKGTTDIGSIQSCMQNKPPVVNAGNDKEVSAGAQTYLSATASDPDGNIVSYLWQKVSGPVGDVISQPASAYTALSFTNEGTYVYRITVTDNQGATASDEISIKAVPNKPPVVNAGNDQEVPAGVQVYLAATASDPDGNIVSYLWQKVSGPAGDVISQPASTNTSASFTNAGTYIYRITVTDNEGATASDEVSVKVNTAIATDSSAIKVTIDTAVYNITAPIDKISASRSGTTTSISGKTENYNFGNAKYASVSFSFSGNESAGTYNTTGLINAGAEAYIIKEGSSEVKAYGKTNQFVEGIFTGRVIRAVDSSKTNPATIPASIVFKAIRKQ